MDLHCDRLSENMIALAHNGKQNGDLMADPDLKVLINPEKQEAVGLTYQNDSVGVFQDINANGTVNEALKRYIAVFLDEWLSNLINCEYQLTETED
jgi:hypothetical protein